MRDAIEIYRDIYVLISRSERPSRPRRHTHGHYQHPRLQNNITVAQACVRCVFSAFGVDSTVILARSIQPGVFVAHCRPPLR